PISVFERRRRTAVRSAVRQTNCEGLASRNPAHTRRRYIEGTTHGEATNENRSGADRRFRRDDAPPLSHVATGPLVTLRTVRRDDRDRAQEGGTPLAQRGGGRRLRPRGVRRPRVRRGSARDAHPRVGPRPDGPRTDSPWTRDAEGAQRAVDVDRPSSAVARGTDAGLGPDQ